MTNKQAVIESLNLGGGPESWFDLWHTHLDWDGEGNLSWDIRKNFLDHLYSMFLTLQQKLEQFPHPYQLWLFIHESDSAQDAIYLHTDNPHRDNFPIQLNGDFDLHPTDPKLAQWIRQTGLSYLGQKSGKHKTFFLYDPDAGLEPGKT